MRVQLKPNAIKKFTPKIRPPKLKSRKAEIVVGIPTLNEADNISEIVGIIDAGLTKYFPDKKAVIVNVDSNSSDKTKKIFLSTKTKTQKHSISTPRGKGVSLRELFEYFLDIDNAKVLMIVSGDIKSANARWVRNLVTPILKGFDHCLPIYKRNEYGAAITDHIAYPVLRGVLGIDIRQPLGAELSLSHKAVDRIYNRKWPRRADRHGVDILMTLSSVFGELRVAEVDLGVKSHTLSNDMRVSFEEILTTFFEMLDDSSYFWEGKLRVRKPPLFFKSSVAKPHPPLVKIDYKGLRTIANTEFKKYRTDIKRIVGKEEFDKLSKVLGDRSRTSLDAEDWMKVVFAFVRGSNVPASKRAKIIYPIFLERFLSVSKKYFDKDSKLLENEIVRQAEMFYKERKLLIKK